jgi:hypothetical protein
VVLSPRSRAYAGAKAELPIWQGGAATPPTVGIEEPHPHLLPPSRCRTGTTAAARRDSVRKKAEPRVPETWSKFQSSKPSSPLAHQSKCAITLTPGRKLLCLDLSLHLYYGATPPPLPTAPHYGTGPTAARRPWRPRRRPTLVAAPLWPAGLAATIDSKKQRRCWHNSSTNY